jgi:hypothetical protein
VSVPSGQTADLVAACNSDEIAISGGFDGDDGISSFKEFTEAGAGVGGAGGRYKVSVKANGSGNKASAFVVCMKISNP